MQSLTSKHIQQNKKRRRPKEELSIEKAISKTLQDYIDQANSTFGKAKEYVILAYNQAIAEGYSPQEAKQLLFEKITVFSDRTIYRYLPDESKNQYFQQLGSSKNLPRCQPVNDNDNDDIIKRINLVYDFQKCHVVDNAEPILLKLYPDVEPPDFVIRCKDLDKDHPEKKWYKVMVHYTNTWIQSVTWYDKTVATTNPDGSLVCWLCLIDNIASGLDNNNNESVKMFSNEELTSHILAYHKPGTEIWDDKYQPYLLCQDQQWNKLWELK